MTETPILRVDSGTMHGAIDAIFVALGSSATEARLVADHLVEANLRGHDSHGVGVAPSYVNAVGKGDLRLNRELAVRQTAGSVLVCNADQGVGQAMAFRAMECGIAHAREHGSAIVALQNSYHIGRIGHWAEQCAAAGLVSIHFANVISAPMVVPFGGTKPRLSTNPFAAGFPRADGKPPIVVDFATSKYALGKVRVARNKGVPVPEGTLIDVDGHPTNDPNVMFSEPYGALLPFGEHKGSGLSLACELLGAALAGGAVQNEALASPVLRNSMMSIIADPQVMAGNDSYFGGLTSVADYFCSENTDAGPDIMLPGEPELRTRAERLAEGLPIDAVTLRAIVDAAASVGVRDTGLPSA